MTCTTKVLQNLLGKREKNLLHLQQNDSKQIIVLLQCDPKSFHESHKGKCSNRHNLWEATYIPMQPLYHIILTHGDNLSQKYSDHGITKTLLKLQIPSVSTTAAH